MPRENWRVRVEDIIECIAKIERYTRGYSFEDFRADDKTVDSALRNLEIIGEASRHVPPEIQASFGNLPWREMQAMRNLVIHEYHGVNLEIIWQTVRENLPPIEPLLRKVLTQGEQSSA